MIRMKLDNTLHLPKGECRHKTASCCDKLLKYPEVISTG
jgi:hypothetical protein